MFCSSLFKFLHKGFSLASFNAGDCEEAGFSRLTLVVNADDAGLAQCLRQLEKLIDVVEVDDVKADAGVNRELALVRVQPLAEDREKVQGIVGEFSAKTPHVSGDGTIVELSASVGDIERLIAALTPHNIVEIVRTGAVAMRA